MRTTAINIVSALSLTVISVFPVSGQQWQWAHVRGMALPENNVVGFTSIVPDGQGGLLAVGGLASGPSFNGCGLDDDIPYLMRYDSDGQCVTARELAFAGHSVDMTEDGTHVVAGRDQHGGQGFITLYSEDETVLWSHAWDDASASVRVGAAMTGDGGTVLTGLFHSSDATAGCTLDADPTEQPIYLVRYAQDGTCLWARQSASPPDIAALTVDVDGNILVTGSFSGEVDLGCGPVQCVGAVDVFIAKFSPDGECLWNHRGGGSSPNINYSRDEGHAISVNSSGESCITGSFTDTATFNQFQLPGRAGNNVFVVKYAPGGEAVWAKGYGEVFDNEGLSLTNGPSETLLIGGRFVNHIQFGEIGLQGWGNYDAFVLAVNQQSGDELWALSAGGAQWNESVTSLAVDGDALYAAGIFFGEAVFGPNTVSTDESPREYLAHISGITGINEEEWNISAEIHPNPTPGPLTITSTKPLLTVAVVDMLGRVLLSEQGNGSSTMATDLSHLPAGIYVVHVETEAGRWAQRVVKQ